MCGRKARLLMSLYITADSDLEERLLPALIVRCVQHLSKWGVEEEGLFR